MKYWLVTLVAVLALTACVSQVQEKRFSLSVGDSVTVGPYTILLESAGGTGLANAVVVKVSSGVNEERGGVIDGRVASFLGGKLAIRAVGVSQVAAELVAYADEKAKMLDAPAATALSIKGNQTSVLRLGQPAWCGENSVSLVSAARLNADSYSASFAVLREGSSEEVTLSSSSRVSQVMNNSVALTLRNALDGIAVVKIDCYKRAKPLPQTQPPVDEKPVRGDVSGLIFLHAGGGSKQSGDFSLALLKVFQSGGGTRVTIQAYDSVTLQGENQTFAVPGTVTFFGGDLTIEVQSVTLPQYSSPSSVRLLATQHSAPAQQRYIQSGNASVTLGKGDSQKCGKFTTSLSGARTTNGQVYVMLEVGDSENIKERADLTIDNTALLAEGKYSATLQKASVSSANSYEADLIISCGSVRSQARLAIGEKLLCNGYTAELKEVKQTITGTQTAKVSVSGTAGEDQATMYANYVFAPFNGDANVHISEANANEGFAVLSFSCGLRSGDLSRAKLSVGEAIDCGLFLLNLTSVSQTAEWLPIAALDAFREIDRSIESKTIRKGEFQVFWGNQVTVWVDGTTKTDFENSANIRYKCTV
ncbi:hypothetical protein HY546_02450 [archaeon]|nr:hypothetical protein [archaeon]